MYVYCTSILSIQIKMNLFFFFILIKLNVSNSSINLTFSLFPLRFDVTKVFGNTIDVNFYTVLVWNQKRFYSNKFGGFCFVFLENNSTILFFRDLFQISLPPPPVENRRTRRNRIGKTSS